MAALSGVVDVPHNPTSRWQTTKLWQERRELAGSTVATVVACVVPASGVGGVDCEWRGSTVSTLVSRSTPAAIKIAGERQRLLADWTGRNWPGIARDVIRLADEWFIYCAALAEREVAAVALAQSTSEPTASTGRTSSTEQKRVLEELRRQMERMAKAGDLAGEYRDFTGKTALSTPEAGDQAVEGVLLPFAGETVFGTPESAGNRLRDLRDDLAKSHVGR